MFILTCICACLYLNRNRVEFKHSRIKGYNEIMLCSLGLYVKSFRSWHVTLSWFRHQMRFLCPHTTWTSTLTVDTFEFYCICSETHLLALTTRDIISLNTRKRRVLLETCHSVSLRDSLFSLTHDKLKCSAVWNTTWRRQRFRNKEDHDWCSNTFSSHSIKCREICVCVCSNKTMLEMRRKPREPSCARWWVMDKDLRRSSSAFIPEIMSWIILGCCVVEFDALNTKLTFHTYKLTSIT